MSFEKEASHTPRSDLYRGTTDATGPTHYKLGRLDTWHCRFGQYDFLIKPDRSSEEPAAWLLSIIGPKLPCICISEDGVRPLTEEETRHLEAGRGQIAFGLEPGRIVDRLTG